MLQLPRDGELLLEGGEPRLAHQRLAQAGDEFREAPVLVDHPARHLLQDRGDGAELVVLADQAGDRVGGLSRGLGRLARRGLAGRFGGGRLRGGAEDGGLARAAGGGPFAHAAGGGPFGRTAGGGDDAAESLAGFEAMPPQRVADLLAPTMAPA